MMMNLLCCLVAFLCIVSISEAKSTTNVEVVRNIDATSAIVKMTTEIKLSDANKEYIYVLPNSQAEHVAFLSVKAKGTKDPLKIMPAVQDDKGYTHYAIALKDAKTTIKITVILTDYLVNYPAQITQNENQLVKLHDSHYYYSVYPTESQKTTIKLASSSVESYTKKAPHTSKGSTITYGPYKDIEPETASRAVVHYQNHKPFAKLTSVQTDIEVSHWGQVSVEEVHEMSHTGAELVGGFSRFDYQMKRSGTSPSFRSIVAVLPGQAGDIFYRDQIGNISSSDMRVVDGEIELELQPRFPMFGGWKSQFYIGYTVPTESMVTVDPESGRYSVKFDFYTVVEDVWVGDYEVKLVLPEGCRDIKVDLPYENTDMQWTTRYTYLDSRLNGGRPVLILRGKNLVEELDSEVVVTYSFAKSRIYVEPFMLVFSFFAFFLFCSLLSRTGGIPKKNKAESIDDDKKTN
jgi:oligosaccharyltransferase complex subunit alpha (ribophorin I)